jgi:hypothetical protein
LSSELVLILAPSSSPLERKVRKEKPAGEEVKKCLILGLTSNQGEELKDDTHHQIKSY